MRTLTRRTVALALALCLIFPSINIAAPVRVGNVMPLHNEAGRNFCTAWHINAKDDLWATAGHCVAGAARQRWTMMISGHKAELVYIGYDEQRDVAVLKVVGLRARTIKFAKAAPHRGDAATVAGYPYGLPVLTVTSGTVAARLVPIGATAPISDILDIIVAGGNSGSPVLNKDGEAIGLLWGTFTESAHSLSIPWESLKRDIGGYFE